MPRSADTGTFGAVDVFNELAEQLWQRLSSLIGEAATEVILRGAVREAARKHAVLSSVDVTQGGVCLGLPGDGPVAEAPVAVRAGLLAFVDSLEGLLTDLTGDILLRKVSPLVQQFRQQVEKE